MKDPVKVLYEHLYVARDVRDWHKARQAKGELEAMMASHKMMWLRDLIYEITGELVPMKLLNQKSIK